MGNHPTHEPDTVFVTQDEGGWSVTVRENGRTTIVDFALEQFAQSYAEGQMARLGIGRNSGPTMAGKAGMITTN